MRVGRRAGRSIDYDPMRLVSGERRGMAGCLGRYGKLNRLSVLAMSVTTTINQGLPPPAVD
jgi:hypothetical protein